MPDHEYLKRMIAVPIGSQFVTPANLEDFAEHVSERVTAQDALSVCGALARRLAEALRTIDDLHDEVAALRPSA
jgi:hypothetical protein